MILNPYFFLYALNFASFFSDAASLKYSFQREKIEIDRVKSVLMSINCSKKNAYFRIFHLASLGFDSSL
ncbi:hypothetical protein CH380_13210 [Leptospira adleri]|uniref:Uncharacterized protein n=1 Tax=Leptospira adleri TaxID=2023186 RepID=A0A2M9YMM1_9LEPT|nr:hypothetical protein CH380_13210 [Leptospira adleri]PJZ61730.1 hypothetical protein CH376_11490 [Leptospira adleri]